MNLSTHLNTEQLEQGNITGLESQSPLNLSQDEPGQMYTKDEVSYLIELAWCVGVFEGEGCITWTKRYPNQRQLKMEMTDKDIMERFFSCVGVGNLNGPYTRPNNPHWLPIWHWSSGAKNDVIPTLHKFLPLLGVRRREKADEALRNYEATN